MANRFEGLEDFLTQKNQEMAAAREESAQPQEEAEKGILDRISETVNEAFDWGAARDAFGSTYGPGSEDMNPTTYRPWGKVEDIAQDFRNAVGRYRENYNAMMNEQGNLQRAMNEAQTTGDYSALENEVDVMRQKGQATTKAMADIAASPFRQAARNFIKNHADDPTSSWQEEAQSLQKTDVNLEYFMTDEEKLQKSREIEASLGLPAASTLASNEAYKAALDMYNLKQKNDSIEDVWEEYPELKTIASMDKEAAAIALHDIGTVKETHGIVESFFTFLERSNKELELNKIQYKMAYGAASEEEIKRADELKRQIESNKAKKPAFFQEPLAAMAAGVAESTPQMIDMAIGAGEGGAVGAVGTAGTALTLASIAAAVMSGGSSLLVEGGIAGARAIILRALASEAGKNMIKKGALAGAALSMYEPGIGRRFAENKEMKKKDGTDLYSDNEARQWARLGSAGETFFEIYPTFVVAAKAFPVAAQVFEQTTDSIIKRELGRETIKDFATGLIGSVLSISAIESGEEALQSVSDDIVHNLSLASKGEEAEHYPQYGAGEIMTRAGNAFVESIPATLGFGIVFGGVGGAWGVGRIARSRKQASEMEARYGQQQAQTMMGAMMVEQLQHTVRDSNMARVAPDVQQRIIREQLNGTGFENAYIDVEMAMRKGSGREDLQKVAEATGMSADDLEAAISVNGYIGVPTEVLAQVETTPEILDSVSFTPEAESMARMRENGKKIVEDYEKKYQKMLDNTLKKVDTIADNYIPDATQEQKEALKAAFIRNPQNPAQGWNELYKEINGELQEKIAPALEALKKGMGNAGLMEVQDEQGNVKTQRYTENDEWYRNFYKVHKRQPTQAELEDMAIAMTIGDPSAPKVAGWVVDSAEMQQAMERDKPIIESLKNQRDTLNSIKGEAKKMTGVEMELTEGLTPEAFKVYRAISNWTEKAGGKIARAGRMTALLWARHADIVADIISKRTGQKYTAEDYIRKRVGFQLVQNEQGVDNMLNQFAGETAENANINSLIQAEDLEKQGVGMDEIYQETGWLKGKDGKWRFEIPDNLNKINFNLYKEGNPENKSRQLKNIYDNPMLYEAYPFLAGISVTLKDMGNRDGATVVRNGHYEIMLNEGNSDFSNSKTLIHEIQHIIQQEERFAVGGNPASVRQQIMDEIADLRKKLSHIPKAKEYLDTNNELVEALFNNADKEIVEPLVDKMDKLNNELSENTREKVENISAMITQLQDIQETDNEFNLYRDLAGEQEARAVEKRAVIRHAMSKNNIPDSENNTLKFPKIHDENAIIVFGGQEMAMSQAPRTLAAYHNTRVDNLEKLLEQGLAVPSIAITHKDIPYDNFGDVTLVGNRNLIDPESGVPVWNRDAYTTRIPKAEYLPTEKKKIKAFMDKWRKNLQGIGEGDYVLDRLEEAAQEEPERVEVRTHRDEFTYYYLTKVLGRDVELKHIRPDYEVPILRNGIYAEQIESIMHSKKKKADKKKALTEVFIARYEKALAEYAESIPKKKDYLDAQPSPKRKMMYEKALERQRETQDNLAALKQTGEINEEQYKEIQKDISRVDKAEKESTEIDWGKTFSEMRANNKDALNSDKYQQWQDKLLDDIRGDAVIKIGRKYEPYTTDNIVRAMLKESGAAQEDVGGFSTSKAAAMGATSLKSIADLHKNESRLVTHEQANKVIADVDTAINDSFEGVREYHKNIAADSYSLPEIYNEAVANAIKGGKKATATNVKAALKKMDFDVAKIPASAIDDVVNAANQMREAAAWYFEAKPQRAVGINEFSGAVVPEDTPAETIQKLIDNGLTVETYNPEVAGDRQRATKAVQEKRAETLFQRAWHGTPHNFEKFDLGAIGTGEGAQVHGWGLYFAKNREVSQRYKEVLSAGKSDIKIMFGDRRLPAFGFVDGLTEAENKAYKAIQSVNYNKDKAIALLKDIGEKEAADVVEKAEVSYKENQGKLFEVEIPDDDVLMDEQKTFSQQPEKVQQALKEIAHDLKKGDFLPQLDENDYKEQSLRDGAIDYFEKFIKGEQVYGRDLGGRDARQALEGLLNESPKAASELLNKYGVKGVTYEGGTDGRCFVVFDDKAIEIIEKYNQEVNSQQGQMLGGIDINPGRDGRRIIHLMETANESTFMHEMAHMFLFDLEELAEIDDISKTELDIVNDWAAWHKGAAEEYKGTAWEQEFSRREQAIIDAEENHDYDRAEKLKAEWRQERFARGFEIYMRQGKAPAKGLKAVFRKFKDFLRAIYKQFVSDGGKPTEAVRRVMDRMIATEEEIDAASLDDRYNDTLAAGGEKLFTENEEETLKRWHEEEREAAKEKVLKLVMKDLEAARQKEFDNRMEDERERYTKQLQQENIFLARMAYEESKDKENVKIWFDTIEEFDALDEITPSMESLVADHMKEYAETLDRSMMESHLSKEEIDKAMDSSKYRVKIEEYIARGMERKKALINKINAKARAAMDSIEDKLNALPEDVDIQLERNDNDTIKAIMKEITKLRFADKWSTADINHIEAMMRASTQEDVRKAIKDLKNRQAEERQNLADVESATKGMEDFFKDLVQQTTATKPMTETCNVNYYLQKERNADRRVKAMIRAKNWDGAISQQRHKVFYTMMVKQARENKEARDKMVADLQRKMNARTVRLPKDERYWFNRILYLMRIGHTDPKVPEGGVADLEDIFKEQQECLDIFFVPDTLTSIVQEGDNFGDYNKLSLARFTATYEDLKRLYTVGRDKFNLKTIAGVTIEEAVLEIMNDPTANNDIATVIRKINPDTGGLNYIDSLGKLGETGDKAAKGVQQYINSGLKVENIIKMLGESAHKYFYKTLEKAAEKEAAMTEKNLKELRDICAMYSNAERQEWTDKKYDFSSERGEKISKENIFAMALNWGTESNRQRLCGGLIEDGKIVGDKSAEQVKQEIEDLFQQTMTEKDWKFIQRLWDLVGSYWHDTAEVEEKLNGVALGRVPNLHFEIKTADGATARLRGGYMHIKYNFEKSSRAEEMEMEDMLTSMQAGARRLGAGRGMTKERSENPIYRTLQLDFTVIENHLQDVIHNIAFRVPLRDVYRLLHYKNFQTGASLEEHLRRTLGVEAYREIDNWALDAWKTVTDERNSAAGILQKMCRIWRSSSVFNIMAYNIWPVVENLSNVAVASDQLGGLKTMAAVGEFYLQPKENFAFVRSMSAFMRTRMDNLDRDLRSQPGTLHAENRVIEAIKEHGYDLLVWSDLMCSAPVWMKAYKDAYQPKIEELKKENDINMQKRLDLAAKVDEIKGQIGDAEKAAAAIDEHLHTRRYGRPEEIEALRGTEYAGRSEGELRAQWGEHKKQSRELGKDLFRAEQDLEQAMKLPVYDDAEMLEEAKHRAVFAADGAIRNTFGSGRNIDLPSVQRSKNELVRMFTAFYGFFNTQFNALYMSYMHSKYNTNTGITKWAPFARTVFYRVALASFIGSALAFGLGLQGDSDKEKETTVTGPDGKKTKVEVPAYERFLKVWGKNALSISWGGLYGIRDVGQVFADMYFTGNSFGYKMGSVASRSITEGIKVVELITRKDAKDEEIKAQQEKKEREHQKKLKELKGKKRQEYLKKWEEEQKYKKPPKRITYPEIAGHVAKSAGGVIGAPYGINATMTNAVISTMDYLLDKDMRFDPTFKNIIWSAIFNKRPVEREIPKRPPAEPKKTKKKKNSQFGR